MPVVPAGSPANSPAVLEAEAAVVGDEPMVDAAAQDIGAETDTQDSFASTQDTGAEDIGDEPEGFPGGPRDPLVLTEHADHVVASVWSGQECLELKLSSHGRKVHNLGRPIPAIEDMVAGTGLSPLITCSIDTGNRGLISSFVKRWHRKTSSFHLPVAEISITLDDVATLLHLPIVGALHDFQPLYSDEAVLLLIELLMVSPEVAMAETGQCGGPYCLIYEHFPSVGECNADLDYDEVSPHACQWIATKRTVKKDFYPISCFSGQLRWGPVVVRYRPERVMRQFGYIQCIPAHPCLIYEHFPSVGECNADLDYDKVSPHACRWIATKRTVKKVSTATYRQCLDHLRILDVCQMPYSEYRPVQDFHPISCFSGQLRWGPVVVRYRPERVMRQFGYIQCIPAHPVHPWVSYDDVDNTWTHYSNHLAAAGDPCVVPDPPVDAPVAQPRHVPQVLESDIPQVLDDPTRSDVNEPRHAVEACNAIAERLERHLSLGVVTPDTSTHEVIKECLKIAGSVTQDCIVYVRSRCRRRIDQS
eukprot:XP_006577495.1 protein MAIN-LIKE 1-like [Glycine max]